MEYKNMSNAELDNLVYKEKNYEAMCELGRRLLYGLDGREKKPGEARKYFNKAAKKGCLEGYRYIGDMYKEGIYFARSDKMAEKYYQLAQGIVPTTSIEPAPPINPTPPVAPTPPVTPTPSVAPTPPLLANNVQKPTTAGSSNSTNMGSGGNIWNNNVGTPFVNAKDMIFDKLNNIRSVYGSGDYAGAEALCNDILIDVEQKVSNGEISAFEGDGILVEALWILANISFKKQDYQSMEAYLNSNQVLQTYPYGYYLMAVSHRIMGLPGNVMNQDMSILMNVKDVGRLSVEERGDVCIMLADLASDGFKANKKLKKSEIKELYRIGMDSGNEYARDKYIQMK